LSPFVRSFYACGFAKMAHFHGYATASPAHILHGRQFIFAHMSCIHTRGSAKTAIGFVSAGIAQMARFVCNGSAIFTCVCHDVSPFQSIRKNRSENSV
jgi:hypothetical protein